MSSSAGSGGRTAPFVVDQPDARRLRLVLENESVLRGERVDSAHAVPSNSNEVWRLGHRYLRICWRGDRGRLDKEALVASHLPSEVPYPRILATGSIDELSWMITEAVPGGNLLALWPSMSHDHRTGAIAELTGVLRALHGWEPPDAVRARLSEEVTTSPTSVEEVLGTDIYPVRRDQLLILTDALGELPYVDRALVAGLRERIDQLLAAGPYQDPATGRVVHSDPSIANVLWGRRGLAALLDFEWTRLGCPDMELLFLVAEPGPATDPSVASYVFREYPELWEHPQLEERLWLYQLGLQLRITHLWPPSSETEARRPGGNLQTLKSVIENTPLSVTRLARMRG